MRNKLDKIRAELQCINIKTTVIFALLVLAGGVLVSIFGGDRRLYAVINKSPLAPPSFVFPIVWTVLYLLIGGAAGAVFGYERKCGEVEKYKGLFLFLLMLMLNYLWYPLFFGAGMFLIAFIDILLMIALTIIIRKLFGRILCSAKLVMTIYLIWLIYAAILNLSVVLLN